MRETKVKANSKLQTDQSSGKLLSVHKGYQSCHCWLASFRHVVKVASPSPGPDSFAVFVESSLRRHFFRAMSHCSTASRLVSSLALMP